jgi:hypothetical protein
MPPHKRRRKAASKFAAIHAPYFRAALHIQRDHVAADILICDDDYLAICKDGRGTGAKLHHRRRQRFLP